MKRKVSGGLLATVFLLSLFVANGGDAASRSYHMAYVFQNRDQATEVWMPVPGY